MYALLSFLLNFITSISFHASDPASEQKNENQQYVGQAGKSRFLSLLETDIGHKDSAGRDFSRYVDTHLGRITEAMSPATDPDAVLEKEVGYAKYNSWFKALKSVTNPMPETFKIPTISHCVWLTNPSRSREIKESDLSHLKQSLDVLDGVKHPQAASPQWKHYIWTNCKACIPKTIIELAEQNIEIKDLNEIKDKLLSYDLIFRLLEKNSYGLAVDILRLDVVNSFGGMYFDLNFSIQRNPEHLMKLFDFFGIGGPSANQPKLENSFMAAKPFHPIVHNALDASIYFVETLEKVYPNFHSDKSYQRIADSLTYTPFHSSFLLNANNVNNFDMMISSQNHRFTPYADMKEDFLTIEKFFENDETAKALELLEKFLSNYGTKSSDTVELYFGHDKKTHSWVKEDL